MVFSQKNDISSGTKNNSPFSHTRLCVWATATTPSSLQTETVSSYPPFQQLSGRDIELE